MKAALVTALAAWALFPAIASCQIGNIVVTSAASFQRGLPAPGSIATIFCTGLTVTGVVAATGTPLPYMLEGVTVTIFGAAAPLFAADLGGYQQINFQVPIDFPAPVDINAPQIIVRQNGALGSASTTSDPTSPGEFFRIGATQFGVFQHALDYSLVTPDNPAKAGETIIAYATGLPPATPPVPIGQPAPLSPVSHVPQLNLGNEMNLIGLSLNYATFLIDPVPQMGSGDSTGLLPIPFMGLAPGSVGLYQINFVFPPGLRPGNMPILLVREVCGGPVTGCAAPADFVFFHSQPVLIPVG
jgi:uncharacterized protein (TIGR03437 family)